MKLLRQNTVKYIQIYEDWERVTQITRLNVTKRDKDREAPGKYHIRVSKAINRFSAFFKNRAKTCYHFFIAVKSLLHLFQMFYL